MQSPMYVFLCNLAVIDIFFINTTVSNILTQRKSICVICCLTQFYIYFRIGAAEFLLLGIMSVDRYLAICFPLHYTSIMKRRVCIQLIVGVWLGSFISMCVPCYLVVRLKFCSSEIDHFFCDIGPLLRNSCTNTEYIDKWVLASSSVVLISLLVTLASYFNIIMAVFKINSTEGKERVFTTCSSHAIAVSLASGSCIFMYCSPTQSQGSSFNKKVSILNTIIVPLINPYIYTLRNQNVKEAVYNVFLKFTHFQ
ncbi:olfactory receptor 6M1-like [Rhinoderma darwinii]|uniref:olfactory receptor 6M1-like n=1 Tax=Rhinoderma darwinii TaxID=43563 RepID=UPI003F661B11